MLSVDWTTSAIVFTISGAILMWLRTRMVNSKDDSSKNNSVSYDEELIMKVYNKVLTLLEKEKYYLNKNVKVSDIAIELGQNEKIVSKAINKFGNGNFNSFINSFRVDYAKELLNGGEFDHFTIEAIALESGFSNKVSFYNAFKSVTGMSPKEFKALKQQ